MTISLPADIAAVLKGKNLYKLPKEEKVKLLARVDEWKRELVRQQEEAIKADPFWYYKPSDGVITPDRRAFLERHLKPDDIPAKAPGQLDVHVCRAAIRGASGGNRSGKTAMGSIEAFIGATGEVPESLKGLYPPERASNKYPRHVRVVGKDWENGILGTVLPEYQFWAPREFMPEGRWEKAYSAEKATLFLGKKGRLHGTIEFMSNAQPATAFQGPTKHKVIYDEEPRKDIYKENLLRFGTAGIMDILFCMTPTEGLSWVYDFVQQGQDEKNNRVEWFKLPSVTNERVDLTVLEQQAPDLSYEEKLMRWLGEFISLSGLVYGRLFNRKIHVIPEFSVRCNCNSTDGVTHADPCPWNHYYVIKGLDPHLVTPTAVVWVALDRWGNKIVVDCWFEEADTDAVKAGIADRDKGYRIGWSVVDSAADSDIKAFSGLNIYKKLRKGPNRVSRLRLASKGQGSIKTGVDEIKAGLRPNLLTGKPTVYIMDTPRNRPLIQAMETLERDRGAMEDRKGMRDKILEAKHHLHAAFRYVMMQSLGWRSALESYILDARYEEGDIVE